MASTTLKENTQTSVSEPLFGPASIDEAIKCELRRYWKIWWIFSATLILLLIPQLRYQVINNIRVAHQMQPEVFVVKHTANVRIIEYTLLGSLNRIAFFLNNFFEDIDLCCRSIFLVIN